MNSPLDNTPIFEDIIFKGQERLYKNEVSLYPPVSMQANLVDEAKKEAERQVAFAKRAEKEARRYIRYMKGKGK